MDSCPKLRDTCPENLGTISEEVFPAELAQHRAKKLVYRARRALYTHIVYKVHFFFLVGFLGGGFWFGPAK